MKTGLKIFTVERKHADPYFDVVSKWVTENKITITKITMNSLPDHIDILIIYQYN